MRCGNAGIRFPFSAGVFVLLLSQICRRILLSEFALSFCSLNVEEAGVQEKPFALGVEDAPLCRSLSQVSAELISYHYQRRH